jgi:hypothetical protein
MDMNFSLPPAPDNLWPKVTLFKTKTRLFSDEDLPVSLEDLGHVLARCIHREMQGSGECAARAEMAAPEPPLLRLELRFYARVRAEAAARLLAVYQEVYEELASLGSPTLPSPVLVKEEATTSYRLGLHEERLNQLLLQALKGELPHSKEQLYGFILKKFSDGEPRFQP